MSMESLMACPDKLVPAARKVTGRWWLAGKFQQPGNFLFSFRADYDLRDEAVETGICSPCQPAEFIGVDPFLRNELSRFLQESHVVTFFSISIDLFTSCASSRNPCRNNVLKRTLIGKHSVYDRRYSVCDLPFFLFICQIIYINNTASTVCGTPRHPFTNSPGCLPNGCAC